MFNAVSYVIYFLFINVLANGVVYVVMSWSNLILGLSGKMNEVWEAGLSVTLSAIIVLVFFLKTDLAKIDERMLWRRHQYSLLVILLFLSGTLFLPCAMLKDMLPISDSEELVHAINNMMASPWGIIGICLLGPVAEEIVFRGAVLQSLLQSNYRPWVAIAVSATLFSIVHMNLSQSIATLIFGLLLGWIYLRTRSVLPCIVFHVGNNTITVVYNTLYSEAESTWETLPNLTMGIVLLTLSVVFSTALVYSFTKKTASFTNSYTKK